MWEGKSKKGVRLRWGDGSGEEMKEIELRERERERNGKEREEIENVKGRERRRAQPNELTLQIGDKNSQNDNYTCS